MTKNLFRRNSDIPELVKLLEDAIDSGKCLIKRGSYVLIGANNKIVAEGRTIQELIVNYYELEKC